MFSDDPNDEEWEDDDVCCCSACNKFVDSPLGRPDNWMVFLVMVGAFSLVISMLIPAWRYDAHGTKEITKKFKYKGFDSKLYGVLHIKGAYSKAWATQSQAACDIRDIGTGFAIVEFGWKETVSKLPGGGYITGGPCKSSEDCNIAFTNHAIARCQQYERMGKLSYLVLAMTFLGVIMVFAGAIAVLLSKRRVTGGVAVGLWAAGACLPLGCAIGWAVVTDQAFKAMSKSAWYPYPSLHWAWYWYISGAILILVADGIFAGFVMPSVWKYDKATEKLDKKKRKLERKVQRDKNAMLRQQKLEELKNQMAAGPPAGGYNFPPPPGVKGKGKGAGKGPPPQQYPPQRPPPQQYGQHGWGGPQQQNGWHGYGYEQQHHGQYGSQESQGLIANAQLPPSVGAPGTDFGIGHGQAQRPPQGGPRGPAQGPSGYWPARQETGEWNAQVAPASGQPQPRAPRAPNALQAPQGQPGGGLLQRFSRFSMRLQQGWNTMPGPPPATRPRG